MAQAMIEWFIFGALAIIAVVTAVGLLVTMSMVRAGLALMSSFVALAGLFVLLDADLLAAIQIMMNVGGMLVMILFMVMMMMDPGGEMMWDMKRSMHLQGPGALAMRMPKNAAAQSGMAMQSKDRHDHGHDHEPAADDEHAQAHDDNLHAHEEAAPQPAPSEHDDMSMQQMMKDMAMSTAQLPWAIAVGVATAIVLAILAVRTAWPVGGSRPTQDAAAAVGELLLTRYMIAFEGAALLIFAGIAGAVIFGKRESATPADSHR